MGTERPKASLTDEGLTLCRPHGLWTSFVFLLVSLRFSLNYQRCVEALTNHFKGGQDLFSHLCVSKESADMRTESSSPLPPPLPQWIWLWSRPTRGCSLTLASAAPQVHASTSRSQSTTSLSVGVWRGPRGGWWEAPSTQPQSRVHNVR